jgi:hypothetical protein
LILGCKDNFFIVCTKPSFPNGRTH